MPSRMMQTVTRLAWVVFVTAALSLLANPIDAQQASRSYRIGVLNDAWAANHPAVEGLKSGLRELGFEEGRDVAFDIRFTKGDPERLKVDAQELVTSGVDLIFTSNANATQAAKAATGSIPIVFTLVGDPVTAGLVRTVAKPGGNVSGISSLTTELAAKRLEILTVLAPTVRRVWAIHHGDDPPSIAAIWRAEAVAKQLNVELLSRPVYTAEHLAATLKEVRPGDALLPPDVGTLDIPAILLEASLAARVPVVFSASLYVEHGGLASYGADFRAQGVQAARLVAKILRGARPADLPVEGADKIDLAVNAKTARLLGLTVPRKVLFRADAVLR
jgi:putative tryptophan/tyrosine transport system substrate-binding protein